MNKKNEIENEEESTEKKRKKKDGGFSCSLHRPVLHVVRAEKNGNIPAHIRKHAHTHTRARTHACTHTHTHTHTPALTLNSTHITS